MKNILERKMNGMVNLLVMGMTYLLIEGLEKPTSGARGAAEQNGKWRLAA